MRPIVIVTGILSSGKSAVARELRTRIAFDASVETDVEVRKAAASIFAALTTFRRLLKKIDGLSETGTVLVEGAMPRSYVKEAREALGERAFVVSLRVSETERARRERTRGDRPAVELPQLVLAQQGEPELFDLVLDTTRLSPQAVAEQIIAALGAEE